MEHLRYVCLSASLFVCLAMFCQERDYSFSLINTENSGLSSDHVNSVFEDRDGVIWMATSSGINRYDGKHCTYFLSDAQNPNSLASNYSSKIVQDQKGRYWITGKNGLTIFDPSKENGFQFRKLSCHPDDPKALPLCYIRDIVIDEQGIIWCSPSDNYFLRIDIDNQIIETIPTSSRILWLNYDKASGCVLAGSIDKGFYELDTKTCAVRDYEHLIRSLLPEAPIREDIFPFSDLFPVTNLLKDTLGNYWLGTTGCRLYQFNPIANQLVLYSTQPILNLEDYTKSMLMDKHGNVWIGTSGHGIYVFDTIENDFRIITQDSRKSNGLLSNGISSLDMDSNGSIWISTQEGVNKYDEKENRIQYFTPHVQTSQSKISKEFSFQCLFEDESGTTYYGTQTGMYSSSSYGDSLIAYPALDGIVIYAIARLSKISLALGTIAGVLEFDFVTQEVKQLRMEADIQFQNHFFTTDITKFLPDTIAGAPVLWIGTNCEGLFLYHLQSRKIQRIKDIACAYDLEKDGSGNIWIGTYKNGVVRIDDKAHFTKTEFHSSASPAAGLNSDFVTDIMIDRNQSVWVVNEGGINIIRHDSILVFSDIGNDIDPVRHVESDQHDHLWFTSKKRIIRYDIESKESSTFHSTYTLGVSYGDYIWMYKRKNHQIWIPSRNTWTIIDPSAFSKAHQIPKTLFTDFKIHDVSHHYLKYRDEIKLPHLDNSLSFHFASHPYTNSKLIKFEWLLEGYNTKWTLANPSSNAVSFTNLAPGNYTFKVKSCSSDGIWDENGAELAFTILPPWWQTWWFKMLMVLTASAIIYYIFRQRTQRLLAIQRIEIEKTLALEAERTRISRDMHDDLGSGLSAIHLMSNYLTENAEEKYPEFSAEINKIRKSSEDLNQSIREIIWTVNTKDDNLNSLILFIRRHCHELNDKVKTRIHVHAQDPVPEIQLSGIQRKHVFLCVKEALNNALKHGKPSEINVHIASDPKKQITIQIQDNGVGINSTDLMTRTNGNGLMNMKERMADIDGTAEILSEGRGTEVRLRFKG